MSGSLRIGMISYYLPSGSKIGVGYQVHQLANEMVRRGHEVTVFSGCATSEGSLYRTETIALTGRNRTFRFAWALRHEDWQRFDVLHAHGDDYWLSRTARPAHVRTFHGSCFAEALHISGARERLRMVLLGGSEILASIVADRAVLVSANTRHWLPWIRTVIPNGVDLRRLGPGTRSAHPSILFVGTYGRRKRGHFLMEVFTSEVLPAVPTAELWMVCEDAPSSPGVKVLGRVSDQELAGLYGSAWVFCLPSTYEGFGIPYIEAMASGAAVVASRNAGAVEVTHDGAFGAVVSDEALGRKLVQLLTVKGARDALAEPALEAVERYDLSVVARQYEDLYHDVCNASKRRRG